MPSIRVRIATKKDLAVIVGFIKELAKFEKLSRQVSVTQGKLEKTLFSKHRYAEVIIAELDGQAVGFALYFFNYSTFLGKPGLYLEDLFVTPDARNCGVGKRLMIELAKIAVKKDCGRFEWSVLDWNKKAIKFYKSLGAKTMDGWLINRVSGKALKDLAK